MGRPAVLKAGVRSLPWIVGVLAVAYQLAFPLAIGRADESYVLVGATRLLAGEVIYRDFFEILTPLGFYFYAGVFALFGTSLLAARVAAAAVNGIGCGLVFGLARRIAGPLEAAVVTLVIPVVCIPAWPYVGPHWLSTTLHLGIAATLLSERLRDSSRLRPVLAGMLGGIAVCVQQQRGAYLAVWTVLAVLVLAFDRPRTTRWRLAWREIFWLGLGGVGITGLVLGLAAWMSSPRSLYDSLYRFAFENYQRAVVPVPWAALGFLAKAWMPEVWRVVLRWAPAGLVLEAIALLRTAVAGRFAHAERVRSCLALLALLASVSVRYFPDYVHVAYVMPFLLIPWARVLHGLRRLPRLSAGPGRLVPIGIMVALVALLIPESVGNLVRAWRATPRRIETAFGTIDGDEDTARLVAVVRAAVDRDPPGERLLVALPGDAWLYVVSGARNATRYSLLLRDYNSPAQIAEAIADVRRRAPGTLVVNTVLAPEDDPVRRALEPEYELVETLPAYRVYRRRGSAEDSLAASPLPPRVRR
jgi:hypothetical protein